MKTGLTHINIILDRSGSMQSIADDTIGGINTFLKSQQEVVGDAFISLYQFDDRYEVVYQTIDVKTAPLLDNKTFVPRGSTALLDAIGRTIVNVGLELDKLIESEKPSKVLVVIVTDGQENASREYTKDKVFQMITHQKNKYNWDFLFLSANEDAIKTGVSYGVGANSSMNYSPGSVGVTGLWYSIGSGTSCLRSNVMQYGSVGPQGPIGFAGFTDEDRKFQNNLINQTK